uniref:DUF2804 domain-containing protein n=1 Tax=Haemonchus contortus TaxID=6289 RepID=A0A7I5E5G7_HAECO
ISYFSICLRSDAVSLPARDMEDKKAQDDTWSNQQVHKTFPQNAVRVVGQPNTYVALWYHCGKPVMGRAWNDCGVMQCAFAVDQKAFTGMEVGNGTIQLLIYKGTHVQNHFYYDWITLSTWKVSDSATLANMLVLVRNTGGGPPGCPCTQCMLENTATQKPLVVNDWGDFVCGSPWPVDKLQSIWTKILHPYI